MSNQLLFASEANKDATAIFNMLHSQSALFNDIVAKINESVGEGKFSVYVNIEGFSVPDVGKALQDLKTAGYHTELGSPYGLLIKWKDV